MKKLNLTKEFLIREYITNKKSCPQIAKETKLTSSIVRRKLISNNIKPRNRSETRLIKSVYLNILTKQFLYKEYITNKKSTTQIAKEFGFPKIVIWKYIKKFGIHIRTISESHKGILDKYSKILSKSFLIKEYITNKKSAYQIANEIGCTNCTILNYLRVFYIPIRTSNEAIVLLNRVGKNNSHWKGGNGYYPYPTGWTNILKESIRNRDNNICQICGKTHIENGRKLDVHHIDYDKDNLNSENLIALCRGCHMKSNGDRETYIEFFGILKECIK